MTASSRSHRWPARTRRRCSSCATRRRVRGGARAVDGVDLTIHEGEILGLAGESGCGKSTIANAVMQILRPPGRIAGGSIVFRGENLVGKSDEELRRFRWRNVSMVFQSAMNALNPVMRVGDQFVDAIRAHERIDRRKALARAGELLELVGIDGRRVHSYPHELSGGMRQRVMIAMALALKPELIVLDEPTTALDVVVQREILQQVEALKRDFGFAVLFITHDVSLLLEFADRIAIMYAGELVESVDRGTARRRPATPVHAGTAAVVPAAQRPMSGSRGSRARLPTCATRRAAAASIRAARTAAPTTASSTFGRRPSVRCCAPSSRDTRSRAIWSRESTA